MPSDYEIKKTGDLVGMDTIVIQEYGRKKYIITAVDYFTRIAVSRVYEQHNSRNVKNLLMRMKIALGTPLTAVNTDNGSEFMFEYEKACKELYSLPKKH